MKYKLLHTIFLLIIIQHSLNATHNRAGEITFKQVSGFTYRITVRTFTYTKSQADRPILDVEWGDNTVSSVYRRSATLLPDYYRLNVYDTIHTFPGPGIYKIVVQDPNRNFGVINIPNSVNVVFAISTVLMISPELEQNSTPVLLSMPIDKAARGHIFIHNPMAFDADGDSVSYKLSTCLGENGVPLQSYVLPEASNLPIYIDPVYGNLIWDSPIDTGIYNIAIDVEEWRDGIKIGKILRDMQIEVYNTDNNPPVNQPLNDYCVVAGDSVVFDVASTDADLDRMKQEFIGGPFQLDNPPVITKLLDTNGMALSRFIWKTECFHVRRLPHNLILKTTDINDDIRLVDIDNFSIRVIGPPPENLTAEATNTEIQLNWDPQSCDNITGYQIFRKIGRSTFIPDSCQTGVTTESGYEMISVVQGADNKSYIDNNNGMGLAQGVEYCYVVAVRYSDGALSIVSNEACAILLPGSPPLIQVSVANINQSTGSIDLAWLQPRDLDTLDADEPFEVIISRSDDLHGKNLQVIHSYQADSLQDTTYYDINLNTEKYPYSYRVEIYNNEPGNRFIIGNPEIASSFYPSIIPGDNQLQLNFIKNVPWLNNEYTVYRSTTPYGTYDSIGFSNKDFYIDQNLKNGTEYCYRIRSKGWRMIDSMIFTNENWSHYNCGTPLDTFPPCAPDLVVHTICDSLTNHLVWNNLNNSCANDVVQYRIFYTDQIDEELQELVIINNPEDTVYFHFPPNGPAACYAISAIDSFNNESERSIKVCVDECSGYELPNVFTPNNDGINDVYVSFNPNNYVKNVNMKIFDRWGMLMYETNDPDINWDGRYMKNNKIVSPGVYYYTCEVFENRLNGVVSRNLVGFIHVYTNKSKNKVPLE